MKERIELIATADGRMETFITHPEEGGPFPAVVVYMDIWGVREELYDVARRVATVGYYCMVPDLYYRQGRVRYGFRDDSNRMVSHDRIDPAVLEEILGHARSVTDAMVIADTGALLDFVAQGEPVRRGPKGCIGYCMGGRHVLRVAGAYPDHFRASASLHGTRMVTDDADSPHLVAGAIRGELYCGCGENDPYTPPALLARLADAMRSSGAAYRCEIHPGAGHGYALPERDVHDRQAAARDWEVIFAMFRRQLAPGP